jgi:3-methyladenine DNA glycosylase AlkD
MTTTSEILKRLRAAGSAANVAGMARYGIRPAKAYGVATPVIRSIAKELGRDTELASALWSTNVLEARMLATMIADPLQIPEEEVERWVREFDCWSVCDSACIGLLWRTPFAWRKVREWSRREPEYERRAAFALLAGLAVHDKKATDKQFRAARGSHRGGRVVDCHRVPFGALDRPRRTAGTAPQDRAMSFSGAAFRRAFAA